MGLTDTAFPFELLRPDVPRGEVFGVAGEGPCRAKLDQNESPRDVPEELRAEILATLAEASWNRYPQPDLYRVAKERLASAIGQPAERLLLTAGGDQGILAAFLAAGGVGRRARIYEPTYPIYTAHARTTGTALDRVVLGPEHDVVAHAEEQGWGEGIHLLVLVRPNNPTGSSMAREAVETVLEDRRSCLVLVDEAYSDFAGESLIAGPAALDARRHPHLLVIKSLSKSLVAGVRLGYGVGHPELIATLEAMLFAPYHLNLWQLAVASSAERLLAHARTTATEVIAERARLETALVSLGVRAWPSRGSFVLFEVEDAGQVAAGLLERGVRLRDVSNMPGLASHLRVTVGTAEENALFLSCLAEELNRPSGGSPPGCREPKA